MVSSAPAFTLSEEDFRLFEENRQSSNRFNRERMELREKLRNIGTCLLSRLTLPAHWKLEMGTEHPAIWNQRQVDRLEVFFMRGVEERKILAMALGREIPLSILLDAPSPLYGHSSLGFIMDVHGIEAGFRIPFLAMGDRGTLKKLLEETSWQEKLASQAEVLSGLTFGVFSKKTVEPLDSTRVTDWEKSLAQLETIGGTDHRSFLGLVRRFPVTDLSDGIDVTAILLPLFEALTGIANQLSWSKDRDLLGLDGIIQAQKTAMEVERTRSEQIRQELIQPKPVIARPIMTSGEPRREPSRRENPTAQSKGGAKPANAVPPATPPGKRSPGPKPAPRQTPLPGKPREPKPVPVQPIQPGDRVILNKGLFQGKEGIVLELLPDSQIRVQVGIMQMNIDTRDCSPSQKTNRK